MKRTTIGFVERIDPKYILGWAMSVDGSEVPLKISYTIDDETGLIECGLDRPDVVSAGFRHSKVGFRFSVPERYNDGKVHALSFYDDAGKLVQLSTIDGVLKDSWIFHFREHAIKAEDSIGFVEDISEKGIVGWALDLSDPNPKRLRMIMDNLFMSTVTCEATRQDVRNGGQSRSDVGFKESVPGRYFDASSHEIYFIDEIDRVVVFNTPNSGRQHFWNFSLERYSIEGRIDGLRDGAVRGWVFIYDRKLETKTVKCEVIVRVGREIIGQLTANEQRPDVASVHGCEASCGFSYVPPADLAIGKTIELAFIVIPQGISIPGSPISVDYLNKSSYAVLRSLIDDVDRMMTEAWKIKGLLRNLIPKNMYSLNNYHEWAKEYYDAMSKMDLNAVFNANVKTIQDNPPLVTVICPVFRPRVKDFRAAIDSVLCQTYKYIELIIVDDASGSSELSAIIDEFAKQDARVKAHFLIENAGISAATNKAISMGTGSFIALFDHDDLLIPQAIEVMINYALITKAKLLYSDEDKIDDAGRYSDVNLKPDWDYRLLLCQNYICHFLMVEADHLRMTGPLRSEFDGAQDHDLILRLTSTLKPSRIVHVPEILYHWRKTPSSTAASGESKSYAVSAGVNCVTSHLKEQGISSCKVTSKLNMTMYDIDWGFKTEPKVTIIIPFREQIEITSRCVETLLRLTEYENYEVVLADNWSNSLESARFIDDVCKDSRVKHIKIPERFNYSRINNFATSQTDSDLLLFLNNDVITLSKEWLRSLVDELISNQNVGAVGAKLLYPTGLIQHGGVVLGVGGIADHSHRLLGVSDPGYLGKAICAQEISAVTAACMLCLRSAFEQVGGFDEQNLHVAYNDVDLCLRLRQAGYQIVWTPKAVAEHHESLSRGHDLVPSQQVRFIAEHEVMMDRWREVIAQDPYYNIHFSRRSDIYHDLSEPIPFKKLPTQ